MNERPIRVTVWNEFVHERERDDVREVYPEGIHNTIADGLASNLGDSVAVKTATLEEPEHGLPLEVLESTDVLMWWGHAAHDRVEDAIVDRVQDAVLNGMGLMVLHSGHGSKIFQRLMGTGCMLRWREAGERERLWIVDPSHPILDGLDTECIELERAEMYGEFFDIPSPDELLMISSFDGGEVFRSACTFRRGKGKIFYFRPGHETYPIYYHPQIQKVLAGGSENGPSRAGLPTRAMLDTVRMKIERFGHTCPCIQFLRRRSVSRCGSARQSVQRGSRFSAAVGSVRQSVQCGSRFGRPSSIETFSAVTRSCSKARLTPLRTSD